MVDAIEEPKDHELIAEEIRVLFVRRKLKQARIARELGWSPWYLGRRMLGEKPFDVNELCALARVLDIPVTDFFAPVNMSRDQSVTGGEINTNYATTRSMTCKRLGSVTHLDTKRKSLEHHRWALTHPHAA